MLDEDPIWINNIQILLNINKLTDFFPSKNQTQSERINSIVRLSFYVSLLLAIYHSNFKYFYIFIFFILFTYILYSNKNENKQSITTVKPLSEELQKINANIKDKPQQIYEDSLNNFEPKLNKEHFTEKLTNEKDIKNQSQCYQPTQQNPFMNATMEDYLTSDEKGFIVDRPPACDTNDSTVKKQIDTFFDNNLFKDISDVWGKVNSQRNFYTMPSTTIPNDRDAFSNWLYKTPKTCKEDQEFCDSLNFEDVRGKRFVFPNPDVNPIVTKK